MTRDPAKPRAKSAPTDGVGNGSASPFRTGTLVVVSLAAPREKFWGALLSLGPAGISVCGINIDSFEDFAAQLRADEHPDPASVFFPMHRVERIDVDTRSGDAPSLAERFKSKTGRDALIVFEGRP